MQKKVLGKMKKVVALMLVFAMAVTVFPTATARADEGNEAYPYVMFAGAKKDGAISVSANNISVNGAIATNGTIVFNGNANVNGSKTEHADEEIIMVLSKLFASYFEGQDATVYEEEKALFNGQSDFSKPIEVYGGVKIEGNATINTQMMVDEDIEIQGNLLNGNDVVFCSKVGNISMECDNINLSGLIYAPYGEVEIIAQNVNMNHVIIIADSITICASSVNMGYGSDMARMVGTRSEYGVIGEGEGVLYATAEYNATAESIDISWYTNVFRNTYKVMVSEDNTDYAVVGTGSYDCEFRYEITDPFERRYVKISAGEIESIPFVVVKGADGYTIEDVDTDGDGLQDLLEVAVETDRYSADTDGDGLNDYQEMYITKTNPILSDTIGTGVSDAEADTDGDGLSNLEELIAGTNPCKADTDSDGLSDFEEQRLYGTGAFADDTDGDGAADGWELKHFYNPLVPEATFEVTAEWSTETVDAKVAAMLAGEQISTLRLEKAEDEWLFGASVLGYLSEPLLVSVYGPMTEATMCFAFDKMLADEYFDPVIYRYQEESQTLEALDTVVMGATAVATIGGPGVYVLVNRAEYDLLWAAGSEFSSFAGNEDIYAGISASEDSNEDGISDYDTMRMCQGALLMGTGAYTPFYGMNYGEIQSNADFDNDGLLNGEEIFVLQTYSNTTGYVALLSNPADADSDYDGISDTEEAEEYRRSNTFEAEIYSKQDGDEYTADASFVVDYRLFFGDNTVYNRDLALLACMYATDMYNNNYLNISTQSLGSTQESTAAGNGVALGKLFGLSGENYDAAQIREAGGSVDTDDVSEFYIGHRRVTYQGATRDVLVLTVRGTNGTHAEWSSNFDVGANTTEYSTRTGSHPQWKTLDNHKGFDVTANRIITLVDQYLKKNGLDSTDIPKSILITGHSRGAAIANVLGAYYEKKSGYDSFVYTFATPYTTTASDYASYKTIFNVINTDDLVTYLPLDYWGFYRYGTDKKISVADKYERTGGSLPNSFEEVIGGDYNDNGYCDDTVEAFEVIAKNREAIYKLDTSSDGTVWVTNKWHMTKNGAKKEMATVKSELENEKLLRYCNLYVGGGGVLYHVDVNYTPAYFMQTLANMASGVPPLLGRDVKGKYVTAKRYFALGSGKVLGSLHVGGMAHPHMPLTYYLIVNNDFENIK